MHCEEDMLNYEEDCDEQEEPTSRARGDTRKSLSGG